VALRSIISSPAGTIPAADDSRDRRTCRAHVGERGERHLRRLRFRRELDRDFGRDRQQALRPMNERKQIVTGAIERVAAQLDDLAGDEHAADAPDVVHRQPVLETVDAARVLADVAADRACDLRRRVGRIVEPVGGGRSGDREVAHTRPHDRRALHRVDRHDVAEFGHRHDHAALVGQRAPRQARARAAGDDGHACRMATAQHFDELRFVLGNRDGRRQFAVHREAVALIGPRVLGRGQ
jgi:hypothetical protein